MIYPYGTKVRVTDGMYKGMTGKVTSTIWSIFGGREYLVNFDGRGTPVKWIKAYELERVEEDAVTEV